MKFSKDFFKKLYKIKNLIFVLGKNAFLTTIFFLFLGFVLGAFIFYKYSFLPQKIESEISEGIFQFDEKTYYEVLKVWEEKEKKFEETTKKEYSDLFRETE